MEVNMTDITGSQERNAASRAYRIERRQNCEHVWDDRHFKLLRCQICTKCTSKRYKVLDGTGYTWEIDIYWDQ